MKKPVLILALLATLTLSTSCSVTNYYSNERTVFGHSKCAANDPIGFFIKQGTGKAVRQNTRNH